MADRVEVPLAEIRQCLDEESLREWVQQQRWYASKSRAVTGIEVIEGISMPDDPSLFLALVQTRFATGTHELYQLPLTLRPRTEEPERHAIAQTSDWTVAMPWMSPSGCSSWSGGWRPARRSRRRRVSSRSSAPTTGSRCSHRSPGPVSWVSSSRIHRSCSTTSSSSRCSASSSPGSTPSSRCSASSPTAASLTSRRCTAGTSTRARRYRPPSAWLSCSSAMPPAVGSSRSTRSRDAECFLDRLGALGAVTAELHNTLASDASDPAFAPEEPSQESLSLLMATIDEDIERIFLRLPDDERLAPIAGRGQDVRERLAARSQAGIGGRAIRTHGDYHLGQTLYTPRGWVIIDFEGEPARAAARAPPEALSAARCGQHAAVIRLRHLGGRDPARRQGARRVRAAGPRAVPRTLFRDRRAAADAGGGGGDSRTCCRSSSSRKPSTSCSTNSITGRTGSRSRSPASAVCSSRNDRRHPGTRRARSARAPRPALAAGGPPDRRRCGHPRAAPDRVRGQGADRRRADRRARADPPRRCVRGCRPRRRAYRFATNSRSTTATPGHSPSTIPTRSRPTLGELDLHLISEGRHEELYEQARRARARARDRARHRFRGVGSGGARG